MRLERNKMSPMDTIERIVKKVIWHLFSAFVAFLTLAVPFFLLAFMVFHVGWRANLFMSAIMGSFAALGGLFEGDPFIVFHPGGLGGGRPSDPFDRFTP